MIRDSTFSDAKYNFVSFSNELDAKMKRFEAKFGTLADLDRQYQQQLIDMRTCPDCHLLCKTQWHMEHRPRKSKVCQKRIAIQNGEKFVPEARERLTCECGLQLLKCNLEKHLQGKLHKNNMKKRNGWFCELCAVQFDGKRPKRDYYAHCKGKKHLKKLAAKKLADDVQIVRVL